MLIGTEPVFNVSEFVDVFNQTLEVAYPRVGVVGELSNFRISREQWVYLDLKDESAQVKFFGNVRQLPGPLEDGMMLEIFGRPRLHPLYGFSVNVESIRVVGRGSIKKAQDLLAKKLEAEGLFDPARKRFLPYAPERIGLITAKDSAAVADFRKIIDARWGRVLIQCIDVKVQGSESPQQIASAIKQFNEMALAPEVLVVIRGGGSPEDLAAFSDERVVRAIAASRLPTLVAVGHETDVSLGELAADMRASTPSNAAEIVVPDSKHEKRMCEMWLKKLEDLFARRIQIITGELETWRQASSQLAKNVLAKADEDLEHAKSLITLLDPNLPLRRGYAIVRGKKGVVVKKAAGVKPGDGLFISFVDGTIISEVLKKNG